MASRALPRASCRSGRRGVRPKDRGTWRGVPLALLAAVTPKCPLCVAAVLAAVGPASITERVASFVDTRLLAVGCAAALSATIMLFSVRRGVVGGGVAVVCTVIILVGRLIARSTPMAVGGAVMLAIYSLVDSRLRGSGASPC
jgi:hypothetical protein